jgi:hypothetical protein
MRRQPILQGVISVVMATALAVPTVETLACGSEACCGATAAAHGHHPGSDAVTPSEIPAGCTMMAACVLTAPAAVPLPPTTVRPAGDGVETEVPFSAAFRSFVAPPNAPPPRA